ncbi:tRNA 2'-phosphotransferase [Exophiala xenobiotica]|nr:tRNA 2'-phosphotransferase [Exophiala xenobiotica]
MSNSDRPGHRGDGGGGGGRGSGRGGGGRGNRNRRHGGDSQQSRSVLVSKALSRLLRHAAVQERIPIDTHGYVRIDHLLAWQKLRSMKPPVTFDEVVEVVQSNEKKRFALRFVGADAGADKDNPTTPTPIPTQTESEEGVDGPHLSAAAAEIDAEETMAESETQRAVSIYESHKAQDTLDEKNVIKDFFIRATQGHSMKDVEAENLLTPITLDGDDPASLPDTVVHGTFYGAWDAILTSGGLKKMNRNHVHFATGPKLEDVLARLGVDRGQKIDGEGDGREQDGDANGDADGHGHETGDKMMKKEASTTTTTTGLGQVLGENKVISGMRSDAQILVYIDIRRALEESSGQGQMKWWRSENGVILTDGIIAGDGDRDRDEEGRGRGRGRGREEDKIVPTRFFAAAVEVKEGLGLLWEHSRGVVQELPERLKARGVPRGKGRGERGRGGGGAGGGGRGRGIGRGRG